MTVEPEALPDDDVARLGAMEDLIAFHLGRVWTQMWRRHAVLMAKWDLKPGAFSGLALIVANPGISQTELARVSGADAPAIVAIMDDLEQRGWAMRARSTKDRRRHSLYATAEGSTVLGQLAEAARDQESVVATAFSASEWQQLRGYIDRMYQSLIAGAD